jgi:hypothetical protein
MTEKEQFDAFMQLSEVRRRRHSSRQELEWKFSISLWALLATSPIYITQRPDDAILVSVLAMVVVVYVIVWVNETRIRNRLDVETEFYYSELAQKVLNPQIEVRRKPKYIAGGPLNRTHWYKFKEDMWSTSGFQIAVTTVLALAAWFLIGKGLIKSNGC